MELINMDNFNEELINFNLPDKENSISFLQRIGLLPSNKLCPLCTNEMTLVTSNRTSDGVKFRCKRPCRKEISIRKNTFFCNSNLPLKTIFKLIYYWAYEESSFKKIKRELLMQSEAITFWKNNLREVCVAKLIAEPVVLGGIGRVVQIDESLFVKRKYNVGRLVKEQWVFGGIDCSSKECFMIPVEKRDKNTLLPIIQRFIRPGTTIVSDLWKAYNCLKDVGYRHLTVNHSLNFVDPVTRVNTNRVENLWMRAKRQNKRECGTARSLLASYLIEFMWRQRIKKSPFTEIINDIKNFFR